MRPARWATATRGADVVEEIDEEEDEDDLEGSDVECAGDIEVEGGVSQCAQVVGCRLPVELVEGDAERHGAEHSDGAWRRGPEGLAGPQ